VPIYCYTRHPATQRRAAMFRGVYTVPFDAARIDPAEVSDKAIELLKDQSLLKKGDWIILTKGDFYKNSGGTNGMKILKVS
jgi:pyruvate kinase